VQRLLVLQLLLQLLRFPSGLHQLCLGVSQQPVRLLLLCAAALCSSSCCCQCHLPLLLQCNPGCVCSGQLLLQLRHLLRVAADCLTGCLGLFCR
jgi:hypothetical protein